MGYFADVMPIAAGSLDMEIERNVGAEAISPRGTPILRSSPLLWPGWPSDDRASAGMSADGCVSPQPTMTCKPSSPPRACLLWGPDCRESCPAGYGGLAPIAGGRSVPFADVRRPSGLL